MRKWIKLALFIGAIIFALGLPWFLPEAFSAPPKSKTKAKFYDFSEQLIDGQIRRPTNLYLDARQKVKFERLLKLKRSFLPELFDSAKQKVFK